VNENVWICANKLCLIPVALVFVAAIPVLALIVFGIMLATRPMYKNVQSGLDKILGITRENLTGVRVS